MGAVRAELADELAPAAGLRNVLVHEYGSVDDRRVHSTIPFVLAGFRSYVGALVAWLDASSPDAAT